MRQTGGTTLCRLIKIMQRRYDNEDSIINRRDGSQRRRRDSGRSENHDYEWCIRHERHYGAGSPEYYRRAGDRGDDAGISRTAD